MGKFLKIGCSIFLILIVVIITALIVGIKNDNDVNIKSNNSKQSDNKKSQYEVEKELITFEGVKFSFEKLYDPQVGVTMLMFNLQVENHNNEEVSVLLTDAYVNDTKVWLIPSGLGGNIKAGKKAIEVYSFGYEGLGFSKVEDIEKIEFKIKAKVGENNEYKTSNAIVLEFK